LSYAPIRLGPSSVLSLSMHLPKKRSQLIIELPYWQHLRLIESLYYSLVLWSSHKSKITTPTITLTAP